MSINVEEQYDKIYRYCYFKLRHQQTAEDLTQETFLRYFQRYGYKREEEALKCLYTIARNLCIDEYRKSREDIMHEEGIWGKNICGDMQEKQIVNSLAVQKALSELGQDEQELLLLRYVNEVPVAAIGQIYGISRFAVRRRLISVEKKFRMLLEREGFV